MQDTFRQLGICPDHTCAAYNVAPGTPSGKDGVNFSFPKPHLLLLAFQGLLPPPLWHLTPPTEKSWIHHCVSIQQ